MVPDWLKTFVGLEGLAEREFVFEPLILPGLLQTAGYAQVVTADTPRVRPDYGERFVGFRITGAARLADADRPLKLHAVITEAALRLAIGTPELRRAQFRHLVAMAALPNVTIQVLRPEDGLHTAMTGKFTVLDFADVRSIGYVELHDSAVYMQGPGPGGDIQSGSGERAARRARPRALGRADRVDGRAVTGTGGTPP